MRKIILFSALLILSGCGGSDDNASSQCSGNDLNSKVFCELQQDYFWYRDLPDSIDPDAYNSPTELLNAVRSPLDRFSYIVTRQEYDDRFINATFFGYGFSSRRSDNNTALQIVYVYDDGSAAVNGLRRGDKIVEIEGVSVADWLSQLDDGTVTNDDIYGPNEAGVMRNFVWRKPDNTVVTANFIKGDVTTNTVFHRSVTTSGNKRIGYLVFNSFIERAEQDLQQAFAGFFVQGVNELILDLRYNGGGYIRVANQLSSQIALEAVRNKVFISYRYNDKNSSKNTTTRFSLGKATSVLNLQRVVVLTTAGTCSASEMVINSLAPFIDVVQVGETTCGKPIGMQPVNVNEYVLSAINFQTVNALGQGDYFDGLQPNCPVAETITGDWGVTTDPLYAEALNYIDNGRCSEVAVYAASSRIKTGRSLLGAPWALNNDQ